MINTKERPWTNINITQLIKTNDKLMTDVYLRLDRRITNSG